MGNAWKDKNVNGQGKDVDRQGYHWNAWKDKNVDGQGKDVHDGSAKNFTGLPGIELSDGSTLIHSGETENLPDDVIRKDQDLRASVVNNIQENKEISPIDKTKVLELLNVIPVGSLTAIILILIKVAVAIGIHPLAILSP